MTKKKAHKREQAIVPEKTSGPELLYSKYFPEKSEMLIAVILSVISIFTAVYIIVHAKIINGFLCFPLDDPWIHLSFARNLVEYGSFSYYKNQLTTSGSTSPAYTILLSILYIFSKNEFIISYILGIGFFSLLVFAYFKLLKIHFYPAMWLVVIATLLVAIQPGINFIADSGMETTMFIFLIVFSLYNYKKKNYTALGISLGLTLWCRPDGLILWAAIIVDYIAAQIFVSNKGKRTGSLFTLKELYKPFLIAFGIASIYLLFNYILSGSPLPNTYRSKLATYQNNSRSKYFQDDVIKYFTSTEFALYWIPFLIAAIVVLKDLIKRQYNGFSIYLIFITGFIFTYWWLIPFTPAYGRYLLPIVPFYIILAVYGVKELLEFFSLKIRSAVPVNILGIGYFAAALVVSVVYFTDFANLYTLTNKYYNDRHVFVGKWIAKNTPVNSVIATHDIGAIEYYGNRKLIDMVGLVSPEVLGKMDIDFIEFINKYLTDKKPDYLVVLKNWFEVENDNPILTPVDQPEFIQVFKYKPNQTHIVNGNVTFLIRQAGQFLQENDRQDAERTLLQAQSVDPGSSKSLFYLAYFYDSIGNKMKTEEYLNRALKIFPDYSDANYMMAAFQFRNNNYSQAKVYLDNCMRINPEQEGAKELMDKIKVKL